MIPKQFFIKIYRHQKNEFHIIDYDDIHRIKIRKNLNNFIPFFIDNPLDMKSICYKHFHAKQIPTLTEWFGAEIQQIIRIDSGYRVDEVDEDLFSSEIISKTENLHKISYIDSFTEERMNIRKDQRWEFSENPNGEAVLWTVSQWREAHKWHKENGHNSQDGPSAMEIFKNSFTEIYDFIQKNKIPYYVKKNKNLYIFINWAKVPNEIKVLFKITFSPKF